MEKIGFADPIPSMIELVTAKGGTLNDEGRLLFPRGLIEDVIAAAPKKFVMPGFTEEHDMEVGGSRVHMGTGGASPNVMGFETGLYRPSTTADIYDVARLVDTLDNIHYCWRPLVARDTYTTMDSDINTSYATMMGTTKHIGVSYVNGENCNAAMKMFDMVLGGEGEFRKRPFCSMQRGRRDDRFEIARYAIGCREGIYVGLGRSGWFIFDHGECGHACQPAGL